LAGTDGENGPEGIGTKDRSRGPIAGERGEDERKKSWEKGLGRKEGDSPKRRKKKRRSVG